MLKKQDIATFAKHMLCPYSLIGQAKISNLYQQGEIDFAGYPYRMQSARYTGNSCVSEDELLGQIAASLQSINSNKRPLLLLSDGKDSMSLALGYAHLGKKIDTVTFLRRDDHDLRTFISGVCSKLGHSAHFVEIDQILDAFDKDVFLSACKLMETPVLDQGFLFFLFGLKAFFKENCLEPSDYIVVDGLGNDETFGYLPSKNQIRSFKLARLGLWRLVPSALRSLKWYLRSPAESHGDLSALACFYSLKTSHDINAYFSSINATTEALSFIDFRAFSRGAFHDHQCMMGKTIASAKVLGSDVVFPWVQATLANYVFNLPQEAKFNFATLTNKVLLRRLLEQRLSWQQQKRGVDLYFDLDLQSFRTNILTAVVPLHLVQIIDRNKLLPEYVKQRAYLELLNFYGFCISQGMLEKDIEDLLLG